MQTLEDNTHWDGSLQQEIGFVDASDGDEIKSLGTFNFEEYVKKENGTVTPVFKKH